jgi:hypothetical protein
VIRGAQPAWRSAQILEIADGRAGWVSTEGGSGRRERLYGVRKIGLRGTESTQIGGAGRLMRRCGSKLETQAAATGDERSVDKKECTARMAVPREDCLLLRCRLKLDLNHGSEDPPLRRQDGGLAPAHRLKPMLLSRLKFSLRHGRCIGNFADGSRAAAGRFDDGVLLGEKAGAELPHSKGVRRGCWGWGGGSRGGRGR